MNKRILISLGIIALSAALLIGGTKAFLSDTETSHGNTFTAGAIDLTIDNECHYNGRVCARYPENGDSYFWLDASGAPTSETCICSWEAADWQDGTALFSFNDVKPGDQGEDTISLHVNSNPAWICAEIENVEQYDNGCNEPEFKAETAAYGSAYETCGDPGLGEGELWNNLYFNIWMDNGVGDHNCNNIKDDEESYLVQDANAEDLQYAIADSQNGQDPITDTCIGVEWSVPSSVNNIAQTDSVTGDIVFKAYQARHNDNFVCYKPQPKCGDGNIDPGETCELPNSTNNSNCDQSSSQCVGYKLQTRDSFGDCNASCGCIEDPWSDPVCDSACNAPCVSDADCDDNNPGTTDTCDLNSCSCHHDQQYGTVTIHKKVINHVEDANTSPSDFQMTLDGTNVNQDEAIQVTVGDHNVGEIANSNYTMTFGPNCPNGVVNVTTGNNITCTVTNEQKYFTITVTKEVINTPWNGNNVVADFPLSVGSFSVTSGISKNFVPGTYLVSESSINGYYGTYSGDCNSNSHLISGVNGEAKVCTITNSALPAQITLNKEVANSSEPPTSFTMRVDGIPVATGGSILITANESHTITEDPVAGFTGTISGDPKCPSVLGGTVILDEGDHITCTITNTYSGT